MCSNGGRRSFGSARESFRRGPISDGDQYRASGKRQHLSHRPGWYPGGDRVAAGRHRRSRRDRSWHEQPPRDLSDAPKTTWSAQNDIDRLNSLRADMFALASFTGGHSFQWNEFQKSLNQVFRETGAFYLLGYVSSIPVVDGKPRRLEVKVNRKGVIVSSRSGLLSDGPVRGRAAAAATQPGRARGPERIGADARGAATDRSGPFRDRWHAGCRGHLGASCAGRRRRRFRCAD